MSTTAIRMSGPSPSPSYVPRSSSSRPSSPSMPAFSGAAGPSGRNPTPLFSPSLPPKPEPYTGPTRGGLSSGHGTHHRSTSLPTSPALTPRLASMERRGSSHLRHEVVRLDDKGSQSQPRQRVITEGAKAILKMMANLPAPLPAELPTKFLPTPNPTPSPPSSASFAQYARGSTPSRKRRHESALGSESDSDISSSSATRLPDRKPVGLGLGLSMAMGSSERGEVNGPSKKRKASPGLSDLVRSASHSGSKPLKSPEIHRSSSVSSITTLANKDRGITPLGSPGLPSATFPKRDIKGQSSLRHELDSTDDAKTMANWSKDKWREMSSMYRTRALLVKRHGDAYQRSQSAQPHLTSVLPADPLRGLLCFSDAVLLWLFSYWGGEQADVRVRGTPYHESRPLREFVRRGWENEMRNAEDESKREMARAMVGLMHMIEAVVSYHLSTEYLAHLSKRGQEIVSASTMHGRSPPSSSGSPPSATGPSPVPSHSATTGTAGTMPSNSAQPGSSSSPDSHSSQSNMISDLMPLIVNSTGTSSKAQTFLLTSRHHLSLRILRNRFPITFDYAINSELADEALPAPGDMLGSAKKLDIDHVERFAWPIELGMHCPVAHTAVFGRSMVKEYAEATGGAWELHLEG